MFRELEVHHLAVAHRDGAFVLDVREPHEYEGGHIPGAKNIPLDHLPHRLHELPRDEEVHVVCASGARSHAAAMLLARSGIRAATVKGGVQAWEHLGKPIVRGPRANLA